MKNIRALLLSLCVGISMYACRPEPIEISMPAHESRLVVSSQFLDKNYVIISVSKSFSSLEGNADSLKQDTAFLDKILVNHAEVKLQYNGESVMLPFLSYGVYGGYLENAATGQTISINIKDSASGLSCRSAAIMQEGVSWDQVQPIKEKAGNSTSIYMDVEFQGLPGTHHYYLINVLKLDIDSSGWRNEGLGMLNSDNKNLILLSNKDLKDGRYKGRHLLNVGPDEKIGYELVHISPEYYRYMQAYKKSATIFNQLTGEPIGFPSNIQQGYGFFSAHQPDLRLFDLSKY